MLTKAYDPQATEDRIYAMWEESGAFIANVNSEKEPFTVTMPPPNATGQLHLGHAVMLALEDIFIRYNRMKGKEVLWVPGTDHAAIATENVVIGKLQKEGINDPREEFGRDGLLEKIKEFVDQSQATIRSQIRKMGSSCDWSREAYTMDEPRARIVNEVFCQMYADGLIYRGHRSVNWDPNLQTGISDDEVEYIEKTDPFYTFQYGPFEIGTVRPETKFGDKYVVMHPDDERYKQYNHLDTFECEWINGTITAIIIKDEAADPEMGTGCMTITPWHSLVDFEIAERHNLEFEQIIDFDGKLLPITGPEFEGMHIKEARPKLIEKLQEKGLVTKVDEKYMHSIAINSRGKGVVEPQVREQWFIDVNKKVVDWKGKKMSLKQVMQDVVKKDDIKIIPERFEKTYFNWVDNLRDWCVSRQIWWGHRIPMYYCTKCKENIDGVDVPLRMGYVGSEPLTTHEACGSSVTQDPDTLDTWFSSAAWTWSTLIDPELTKDPSLSLQQLLEQSPDYKKFHPTQVMETGYDIIFFWVARMILMTTYVTGEIPFEHVYLHGLIRTREGKKMSKSKPETCIDPLEIIPNYGADALRLSMIVGQSAGNDSRLYEEKIGGYRNFINKLWNASRFVLMQCNEANFNPKSVINNPQPKSLADKALMHSLQILIDDVTKGLEEYKLSDVGDKLYSFVWDYFCDWYLELSKGDLNPEVLVYGLRTILQLLHPYCPFVTEELWSQFFDNAHSNNDNMLMKQNWPVSNNTFKDEDSYNHLQKIIDLISAIRSLRSENGIDTNKKISVVLKTNKWIPLLESQESHIKKLAKIESLTITTEDENHGDTVSAFLPGIDVHILLDGLIDKEAEKEKLLKEKMKLEGFIIGINKKLSNEKFVNGAPQQVITLEKEKLSSNTEKLEKVIQRLESL